MRRGGDEASAARGVSGKDEGMIGMSACESGALPLGEGVRVVEAYLGVLRAEDFARFLSPGTSEGARLAILSSSPRIHGIHRITLGVAHLLPILRWPPHEA
mgnify:CR=1 FL=1